MKRINALKFKLKKVERNCFRLTFSPEKDTLLTSWQLFLIK